MKEIASEIPIAMVDVNGKTLLDRQMSALARNNIHNVHVVGGYKREKIKVEGIHLHENDAWRETGELHSILCAGIGTDQYVLIAYSDILFDAAAVSKLLRSGKDITLLADGGYRPDSHEPGRKVDLVVTDRGPSVKRRALTENLVNVKRLGLKLDPTAANAEFVGLALFSPEGWKSLISEASILRLKAGGPFHEAPSFSKASLTDMIQHLIERGHAVHAVEVSSGWIELHSFEDYKHACRMVRNA
jgi:phosphoenolpyruvate phosphomutase